MINLPGYHLSEQLYESDNSRVYRGYREADQLPVVLKVLRDEYPLPAELARYTREYELLRALDVEGVIKAYDLRHTHQHAPVLIVEDFGGESLDRVLSRRRLTLTEFLALAIRLVEFLGQVHRQQVIHKDINPSNIVWNPETGQLKYIDFGLATKLSRENPIPKNPETLEGTLAYLSPEQTGRMNRSIDYRTDFYSLGVTFYELLTGQLPFDSHDPLEVVHAHMARVPRPPSDLDPAVPQMLSRIVLRLMAKTAEERYQSPKALKADLEECQRQLAANGRIDNFVLGEGDISDRFQIPERLYGREAPIQQLLAIFDHVAAGHSGLVLCLGEPGIGKSALIHEVHKPIVARRGNFIGGKYDQFQRDIPYSALTQAFQEFVRQVLTESETHLARWREALLRGVGHNGQVIIDVIPELELVIGPQPEVETLPAVEAQNRFHYVFQNFVRAITGQGRPLVLFLDDLQWADVASLNLLKALTTDLENRYFLVIGAFRDTEVGAAHPLALALAEITQTQAALHTIRLGPLALNDVHVLITDTLRCPPPEAGSLAELVCEKTQGNAFFVNQFLKSLAEDRLLAFDSRQRAWRWDTEQIRARQVTDNVVLLMAGKILKLPGEARRVLQLAACIGDQFDFETLTIIHEARPRATLDHLWPAVVEGLVLPLDDNYVLIASAQEELPGVQSRFRFLHDRVQQAAYGLIPESDRQVIHLNIGRRLLATTLEAELDERLFDIVNHLNHGLGLMTDPAERGGITGIV
jgi:hypothetical protein